ncbi:MAG: trypsin-like peptidase domain-containing protein, partial [Verrucomicrobiota bacterium]|nr:trypsin-like peptidase domain-containing protein [Verrucomicrobiota bacterium]
MRRLFLFAVVCALLGFAWYRHQQSTGGNRRVERYTPAAGPKLGPAELPRLSALDEETSRLVEAVVPSVVSVTSARRVRMVDPFQRLFGPRREQLRTALGSGVIISKEGHILTNRHVIEEMEATRVQLSDGRILPAELIGSDPETDIAVLKVSAPKLEPLPLADSDQVRVGQMVFAIGNPFGLNETVTQGIISAKGRRAMRDSDVEFLQTDAAVNQGNSGGPLLNLRGEIIGINTAIYSETGGWLGISFAVPSNTARRTLESVIKTGRVRRGYLGIAMQELTPQLADSLGLPDTHGALVAQVEPGSPAERAGLREGDVIRSINGRRIGDLRELSRRIVELAIDSPVEIGIIRDGREQKLHAQIAEAPP